MPTQAGASFQAAEIVDLYTHRPPYPPAVCERIAARAPATGRLLDLGCGEGKIARPMTQVFQQVVAVDPSANMIALGASLKNGAADNLTWLCARAEEAPLHGRFDVVTFASSIHWMEPAPLFARLRGHLGPHHLLAFVRGDEAFEPPWHAAWRGFLARWVPEITGQPLDSPAWQGSRTRHLPFVDVVEDVAHVSDPVVQSVDSFILCQHSRDSFALSRLGPRRDAFRRELDALLRPHADADGLLRYRVRSQLTLATLRAR